MPLHSIYVCENFDVLVVDFIGPFPPSCGYTYILLFMDYVSKWVEAVAIRTVMLRLWLKMLNLIFCIDMEYLKHLLVIRDTFL